MATRDFVWTHETARFLVALSIEPEDDLDPADSFEFPEDIAAVRNGDVEWFRACVTVYGPEGEVLGSDSLGGCAYKTVREFYTAHRDPDAMNRNSSIMRAKQGQNVAICHYFPDMVRIAIKAAREQIAKRAEAYRNIHA